MDLEQSAFEALRFASAQSLKLYKQPLVITYSGGKDSDVLLHLAGKSGIPYEVLHSLTTADAPETVWHVRDTFRRLELANVKCTIDTHRTPDGGNVTMWNLIPRKLMPPTRRMRYCCAELKEGGAKGRFVATGVRWAESPKRKDRGVLEVRHGDIKKRLTLMNDNDETRMQFENCQMKGQRVVNPIIGWDNKEVWDYAETEKICMNPLYGCGRTRVGCIGCPLASKRARIEEFIIWPKYKQAYIRAFDRMLEERHHRGKMAGGMRWGETGVDVFNWWMENGVLPGQEVLEEFREDLI